MGLLDKIKYGLEIPRWQQLSPSLVTHAAGICVCGDKRVGATNLDAIFQLQSATALNVYYGTTGSGAAIANPGISAMGAGSAICCYSSILYSGTIGSGSSSSKIITTNVKDCQGTTVTTTTLDSLILGETVAAGVIGFIVRVITNSAAGSAGRIEERMIYSNTAGSTPTIFVNQLTPLTTVPVSGDSYEIIGLRAYCLGNGATAATQFRFFDAALSSMTSCAGTGLTIATDSSMIALDEQYTPYDRKPGEGFVVGAGTYDAGLAAYTSFYTKYCLTATGTTSASLSGQASSGDYAVIENEYRNFQIRIVEDTTNPTAVNQRRIITSHTAGPTPVYSISSAWTVTPSSTAKYVIELPNLILLFTVAGTTSVYTYNPMPFTITNAAGTALASNTWSSTYFTTRAASVAAGTFTVPSYGHEPTLNSDGSKNSRHSYIYNFRGGSTTLDMLDIAGGTAGAWSNNVSYNKQQTSFSTASCGDYAPFDQLGQWGYCLLNTTGLVYRFNVKNRSMFPWPNTPLQSGTAVVGNRIVVTQYYDSTTEDKLSKIHVYAHTSTVVYRSEAII